MVLEDVLMMKYGKSISVEELFEPVLCALRCRWRRKQALLLLSLQTGEVAYWQNGEHSWQEQLNEECLADKQRLTDALAISSFSLISPGPTPSMGEMAPCRT